MVAALLALATTAQAQDKVWTAAPVPSIGGGDTVLPAARAGGRIDNDGTTPFSSVPSSSVAADGATSANDYNGVGTPNLGK